jgi:hypothetical protein
MRNPVDLVYENKNGLQIRRTYEHEAISRWLSTKSTDPLAGHDRLTSFKLVPNVSLREKILQAVIGFAVRLSLNKSTLPVVSSSAGEEEKNNSDVTMSDRMGLMV